MSLKDMIFQSTLGMSKETFFRTANLMRNPEGSKEEPICPVCKKSIRINDQGDSFCINYNSNYEKEGGCCWHRYSDGLNYWSSMDEILRVKAEEYPELKEMMNRGR